MENTFLKALKGCVSTFMRRSLGALCLENQEVAIELKCLLGTCSGFVGFLIFFFSP